MEEQSKRKLTAILSADVKGYSRLMQDDEEATVRTIRAYREVTSRQLQPVVRLLPICWSQRPRTERREIQRTQATEKK